MQTDIFEKNPGLTDLRQNIEDSFQEYWENINHCAGHCFYERANRMICAPVYDIRLSKRILLRRWARTLQQQLEQHYEKQETKI